MSIDYVPMKLVPGEKIIPFELGQVIKVYCENMEMEVPMKVIRVYENGDFDGEVGWEEA